MKNYEWLWPKKDLLPNKAHSRMGRQIYPIQRVSVEKGKSDPSIRGTERERERNGWFRLRGGDQGAAGRRTKLSCFQRWLFSPGAPRVTARFIRDEILPAGVPGFVSLWRRGRTGGWEKSVVVRCRTWAATAAREGRRPRDTAEATGSLDDCVSTTSGMKQKLNTLLKTDDGSR